MSLLVGLPVSVCGLLLRGWAAGHLAKNRDLAVSGPYAYMRNPLYAGTLITAAGIVISARSWILASIFAAVFLLVYLPAIELEEQHLRSLFPDYAPYAKQVNRFLPMAKWRAPNSSFATSLYWKNQEYKASLGFLLAVAWLVWKCFRAGLL
jgi:protein-S-isoprenylcysteine O-methyltransferase Ste14